MPTSFSNRGYVSSNGRQSSLHREHAIYSGVKRGGFLNLKASPKRMETKLFLTVLSYVGIGSYIGGILLNLSTWKSDILFISGFAFIVLKFIRLIIKTYQSYKREEIEQDILRRKIDEDDY